MVRNRALIQADIDNVENQLSPENLTCDGELKKSQWLPKQSRLNRELKALHKELNQAKMTPELKGLLRDVANINLKNTNAEGRVELGPGMATQMKEMAQRLLDEEEK